MSARIIIVSILFVLAVLAAAQPPPRKPNPPPRFTSKVTFFDANGINQMSMQLWYNFPENKFKNLQYDRFGNEEGLVIVRGDLGKEYEINTTALLCKSSPAKPPQDIWGFMATAVFNGTQVLPNGQKCNNWIAYTGNDYTSACFVGDIPLNFKAKFAFFDTEITVNAVVTNFQPSVSPAAFDLPSFCTRNIASKPSSGSEQFKRALSRIFF